MFIQLVIFDLDGTLVDSSEDITNALNYALMPHGFKPLAVDDTVKMVGEGLTRLIDQVIGNGDISVKNDVMNRFLEHYAKHILDCTREYPGVRETLDRMKNYKKAVISNKKEALSRMVLDGLKLSEYFDIVIGSDTTSQRKPSPVPILKVLTDLHVSAGEAVIVGDSDFDIDAGKAAGIHTVAVTYGYRQREVIAHADHIIDRMTDLIPFLKTWTPIA
ncbi:MAG: HAD-IA family hydrolase [Thermodesulfovibrionales bacterium]|jgi:phosphoglycolate phosphatase